MLVWWFNSFLGNPFFGALLRTRNLSPTLTKTFSEPSSTSEAQRLQKETDQRQRREQASNSFCKTSRIFWITYLGMFWENNFVGTDLGFFGTHLWQLNKTWRFCCKKSKGNISTTSVVNCFFFFSRVYIHDVSSYQSKHPYDQLFKPCISPLFECRNLRCILPRTFTDSRWPIQWYWDVLLVLRING